MAELPLVIYGCGTQGRAIIEFVRESAQFPNLLLVDDDQTLWGADIFGIAVLSPERALGGGPCRFLCTIGDNEIRETVIGRAVAGGHRLCSVFHPTSIVSPSAQVGDGTILMSRAVVNTGASVGRGSLLNTGCVVEHHAVVGDFTHLGPGSLMGGGSRVGSGAFLGMGAIVLPRTSVGDGSVVGAGAVVNRDVDASVVVVGNPARVLRALKRS